MPQTTSEKAIRKDLQKHFKTDISDKKQLVKEHVSCSAAPTRDAGQLYGFCSCCYEELAARMPEDVPPQLLQHTQQRQLPN
jgi:hypothetical protein